MNQQTSGRAELAERLRDLRTSSDLGSLTQRQLAEALGASTPLISSWEGAAAIPPDHRLRAYGRFFATRRSVTDGSARLLGEEELVGDEIAAMEKLLEELFQLRDSALKEPESAPLQRGALGGRFWHFPDGNRIVIVCTPLSNEQLGWLSDGSLKENAPPISAFARPIHPNYIGSLRNGDMDACIELVAHIRAENPAADVRWTTFDRLISDDFTGHVILLGPGKFSPQKRGTTGWFIRRLELPVHLRLPSGGNEEFDSEFVVNTDPDGEPSYGGTNEEVYRPRFFRTESAPDRSRVTVDGVPQLEHDVALLVRKVNPLNLSARITICAGVFRRGTYGAVRAFTDPALRSRNEQYITRNFANAEDFWLLLQVPVFTDGQTVTPDLERASSLRRSS